MAEENNTNAAAPSGEQPQVRMQILAQFTRDLSFENAVAQQGASEGEVAPEVAVQVSLDARKRGVENHYEVISKYRISAKNRNGGKPLYLVELDYAGVFLIEGIPEDRLHPFLMIECPRLLFPFARRVISDVTSDGGFPALNLDNIDFVALYRHELARRAQQGQNTNGAEQAPVS